VRRIIVCGCRDWTDRDAVFCALTAESIGSERVVVVHGDASGADRFGGEWAQLHGDAEEPHRASWQIHGKSAGPRRNSEMASLGADLCLAFWDGKSKGTAHMIKCAVECGIPVRIVPKSATTAKGGG